MYLPGNLRGYLRVHTGTYVELPNLEYSASTLTIQLHPSQTRGKERLEGCLVGDA